MKKFFSEFKTFAMRGNVMDMAIGVVIGAAFGKITTSIVNDIIMPLIGLLTGGIDLAKWNILLNSAAVEAGARVPAGGGRRPSHAGHWQSACRYPGLHHRGVCHVLAGKGHE